jgi:hypothetical protein
MGEEDFTDVAGGHLDTLSDYHRVHRLARCVCGFLISALIFLGNDACSLDGAVECTESCRI